MAYLRAIVREADDYMVEDETVLQAYHDLTGADPGEYVWADDIPDEAWDLAKQYRDAAEKEETHGPVAV